MGNAVILLHACLACCLLAVSARGGEARVQVATLDGEPVYHWRTFKSVVPNDVDRALVLREFGRKQFKIPAKLVNDEIKRVAGENLGGDVGKLRAQLHAEGASLDDFKRFTTEEIIVSAMRYQKTKGKAAVEAEAEWLAGLRAGADVKMLTKTGEK